MAPPDSGRWRRCTYHFLIPYCVERFARHRGQRRCDIGLAQRTKAVLRLRRVVRVARVQWHRLAAIDRVQDQVRRKIRLIQHVEMRVCGEAPPVVQIERHIRLQFQSDVDPVLHLQKGVLVEHVVDAFFEGHVFLGDRQRPQHRVLKQKLGHIGTDRVGGKTAAEQQVRGDLVGSVPRSFVAGQRG